MDPITAQLTANPVASPMANASGGMQQMPFGPMPQVPLVPTGFPSTPYAGAQAAAPQGGLSQIPTVAQNNPAIPNAMAPMQGTPAYQRIMQVMNQMRQQMPQMSQFAGFNLPTGAQPNQAPAMDGSQNILNRLFSGSFGKAGAYNPFGNRFGFRNYERDQYGNPVAPPVMNDYQGRMPSLMQRYGMM